LEPYIKMVSSKALYNNILILILISRSKVRQDASSQTLGNSTACSFFSPTRPSFQHGLRPQPPRVPAQHRSQHTPATGESRGARRQRQCDPATRRYLGGRLCRERRFRLFRSPLRPSRPGLLGAAPRGPGLGRHRRDVIALRRRYGYACSPYESAAGLVRSAEQKLTARNGRASLGMQPLRDPQSALKKRVEKVHQLQQEKRTDVHVVHT
jgi:hypothetical protein